MQFSFVTFFALALALAATVLPAFATPISTLNLPFGSRPRIGTIIKPPSLGNAPIAMNIPGVSNQLPNRRDGLNLDSVMWKRILDLHCTPAFAGTPLPADCYNRPPHKGHIVSLSTVAARAFMAGLMH